MAAPVRLQADEAFFELLKMPGAPGTGEPCLIGKLAFPFLLGVTPHASPPSAPSDASRTAPLVLRLHGRDPSCVRARRARPGTTAMRAAGHLLCRRHEGGKISSMPTVQQSSSEFHSMRARPRGHPPRDHI